MTSGALTCRRVSRAAGMRFAKTARTMPRNTDALVVLAAQHAQIDDLYDLVATLRDPDALDELAAVIAAHLGAEQELLYPNMPSLARSVLDELEAEHAAIKRVVAELLWFGVSDPDFVARLEQLGALLDGHIGYQEDALFERAEQTMLPARRAE